ncbi:MAG: hypothetical protein E7300_01980 [Lachnospiraceae bacterium]|nr:hypothetical protein [Lachnospiraceae bacterium]
METTKRLFDEDAYLQTFMGTVASCKEAEDEAHKGLYAVILDRTAFFPEEGGQSPDTGYIGDATISDVQIRDDVITHYADRPLPAGSSFEGRIDWDRRFSNMQQHSGEHIFSGLVYSRFGYHNVGFHLSDHVVSMDFDGVLTPEDAAGIEKAVNGAIYANVPITVSYPSREEEQKLTYRSKKEIKGQIRLVTVEGYDICACCAPHVHRSGEIGILKVMSLQNYKKGVRITILCGYRALDAFRAKNAILSSLTGILTTGEEETVASVTRLKDEVRDLKGKCNLLKQELLQKRLSEVPGGQEDLLFFEDGIETSVLRHIVNEEVKKRSGFVAGFGGNDASGYAYIAGSVKKDCRDLLKHLQEALGAKGGGKAEMIQGSVPSTKEKITEVFEAAICS